MIVSRRQVLTILLEKRIIDLIQTKSIFQLLPEAPRGQEVNGHSDVHASHNYITTKYSSLLAQHTTHEEWTPGNSYGAALKINQLDLFEDYNKELTTNQVRIQTSKAF